MNVDNTRFQNLNMEATSAHKQELICNSDNSQNLESYIENYVVEIEDETVFLEKLGELLKECLTAENFRGADLIADTYYNNGHRPDFQVLFEKSSDLTMESFMYLFHIYCECDYNPNDVLSHKDFVRMTLSHPDPRVKRFVEKLGHFIKPNGRVPCYTREYLENRTRELEEKLQHIHDWKSLILNACNHLIKVNGFNSEQGHEIYT